MLRNLFLSIAVGWFSQVSLANDSTVLTNLVTNSVDIKDGEANTVLGKVLKICETKDECVFGVVT